MFSMIKKEKKVILLSHYFLYVVYDGARGKTHFVRTLFFVWFLGWGKRKNSFCNHIIFFILSMMQHEKKLILLEEYFFSVVYGGAREKIYSVTTLFFVYFLWWSKRKNSFFYTIIFSLFSMMEQEKKLILLQLYFFCLVYDGARGKTPSVLTLFFVCSLWWTKRKNSFCWKLLFCMFSKIEQEKELILL